MSIDNDYEDSRNYRDRERSPAFQLNKFQSEYNLSFNNEMAKIIAYALQNSEEFLEKSGKNIPPPLFALLSRLEDLQKPKFYKDYSKSRDYDGEFNKNDFNKLKDYVSSKEYVKDYWFSLYI